MRMGLALGLAAAGAALVPHPTLAQEVAPEFSCKVGEVAVYSDRIHVFCSEMTGSTLLPAPVRYFSVEISDPIASHAVIIASAATISGRPIAITAAYSANGNPSGCQAGDCRRLVSIKGFAG